MTALYQDFLAVLLLYISLVMRQSSGWACSANDKKKNINTLNKKHLADEIWEKSADLSLVAIACATSVSRG